SPDFRRERKSGANVALKAVKINQLDQRGKRSGGQSSWYKKRYRADDASSIDFFRYFEKIAYHRMAHLGRIGMGCSDRYTARRPSGKEICLANRLAAGSHTVPVQREMEKSG